ncbi:unnamed protein product [Rhizophagus irregularis]|nr:unnamed protein product [Rhizophagus irregularis]
MEVLQKATVLIMVQRQRILCHSFENDTNNEKKHIMSERRLTSRKRRAYNGPKAANSLSFFRERYKKHLMEVLTESDCAYNGPKAAKFLVILPIQKAFNGSTSRRRLYL